MKLTIILPTYNNQKTLDECLKSIFCQKFPKKDFEVLLIDGGSDDKTLEIAKKYPVKILHNEKRVEEAARILGINIAKGKIIGFVDADNVLVGNDWLEKMIFPFEDERISFADTLYFSYRKQDKIRVRYQGLIGGDDPIISYLGLHSRWSYLNKSWTDCPHEDFQENGYLRSRLLDQKKIPPMGSNGFFVRTNLARKFVKDSFIHSDFVFDLINAGHEWFAKVDTGIIHNQPKFFKNKIRRVERRLKKEIKIKYNYGVSKKELAKVSIYILLIFPVLVDTIIGFFRKRNLAWIFHPVACFGEMFLFGWTFLRIKLLNYGN